MIIILIINLMAVCPWLYDFTNLTNATASNFFKNFTQGTTRIVHCHTIVTYCSQYCHILVTWMLQWPAI